MKAGSEALLSCETDFIFFSSPEEKEDEVSFQDGWRDHSRMIEKKGKRYVGSENISCIKKGKEATDPRVGD